MIDAAGACSLELGLATLFINNKNITKILLQHFIISFYILVNHCNDIHSKIILSLCVH